MEEKAERRRIGLFGGTFNPIHLGHLRGAEEIREAFGLHQVIFIPAALPPHKTKQEVIEAHHRFEMVKLAIADNPFFSVTDIELSRPEKSYSIDTIRYFRNNYLDLFYFILGGDAFWEIETWKEFQDLFSNCNFIVMTRPGVQRPSISLPAALVPAFHYEEKIQAWVHTSGHLLSFKEITVLDISSTKVRETIEERKSVRYLVPAEIEAYIEKYGLYRRR